MNPVLRDDQLPSPGALGPGRASSTLDQLTSRCQWPAGRSAALAVSGGPDSLALLVLAAHAGLRATAIHVDHGLRAGSGVEAEVVAHAAARFGLAFEARCVAVGRGPNLEARARAARYAALPDGVLTGHTADDQAETVLLNLLRGAGLDGLAGMVGRAGARHPLIGLRRTDTEAVCAESGLRPVRDPSNADPAAARRNAVRSRLLPALAEVGRRDPVPVLVRQAALLADDAELLERLSSGLDPTDAPALAGAEPALARRAVRRWLRSGPERHPPSAADVERVLEVAAGRMVACEVSGGRRVARHAGRLGITGPDDR